MSAFRYLTAGESHGRGVLAVVEGLPSGIAVDVPAIDADLRRRQGGYGRGGRQRIEEDAVEFLAGLRRGRTIGSPVAMWVANRDHRIDRIAPRTVPRPGHADLAGLRKRGESDVHTIAERASARETAGRVAAGGLAAQFLAAFGVKVRAYVVSVGDRAARVPDRLTSAKVERLRKKSELYTLDARADAAMRRAIDAARKGGDTLGGTIEIVAWGLPPGLGDCTQWDRRLDGRLARAVMSIQAIKGVEIGLGFAGARRRGSRVHDPIVKRGGGICRTSNNAGGLEGGITNGEPLVVRAAMKPISTLMKPLPSVDLKTGKKAPATVIRSDICAVPAASVVGEAAVALELARAFREKFGGDSMREAIRNVKGYLKTLG